MILTANGQNIYPEEIESRLNAMPHIAESIVVERDKRLVAIVAPTADDEGASDETLAQYMETNRVELNETLPSYSKITKIEILREGFQHTPKHSIKRFLYQ